MTDNHGYNRPSKGTTDWHVPLNENFDQLDRDIEIRDDSSALEEYVPKDGAKFLATDTGRVYIGDGDTWNELGKIQSEAPEGDFEESAADIQQLRASGYVVVVYDGANVASEAISPTETDTPIQDGLDACGRNGGGEVYLPFTTVRSPGNIVMHDRCSIYGSIDNSAIEITSTSNPGIVFDPDETSFGQANSSYIEDCILDGFELRGPTDSSKTEPAIIDNGRWRCRFGRLTVRNWANSALKVTGGYPFANTHDYFYAHSVDAGNAGGIIDWGDYGAPNWFNYVEAYPTSNYSDNPSVTINGDGGNVHCGTINVGGVADSVVHGTFTAFSCQYINYEPWTDQTPPIEQLVRFHTTRNFHIGTVEFYQGEADYVYRNWDSRAGYLGPIHVRGQATLNNNYLDSRGTGGNRDEIVVFAGPSSQVSGDDSHIAALGDLADAH